MSESIKTREGIKTDKNRASSVLMVLRRNQQKPERVLRHV